VPADLVLEFSGIKLVQLVHVKTETGRHEANNRPVYWVTGNATSAISHEFHMGRSVRK
jgi:hypothetical protein